MQVLFLHGLGSEPGGNKPAFLNEYGHEFITPPALPNDDFDESVRMAEAEHNKHSRDVIVGSSRTLDYGC